MEFLFIVLYFLIFLKNVSTKSCYWNSVNTRNLFSSKSPYDSVRGDIRDSVVKIEGCEPISIWGIYRHGKRNPREMFLKNIKSALSLRNDVELNFKNGTSSMCAQDVENLSNWRIDEKLFEDTYLTDEGYEDMVGIGRRFKQAYPELLETVGKGDFTFRGDYGGYVIDSATAFIKGFDNENITVEVPIRESDNMAPYLTCHKYLEEVRLNSNVYSETEIYMNTSEYREMLNRLHKQTGIDISFLADNVTALYDLCRYTWAGNHRSPWCALFTNEDLMILEYVGDLRHYYRNSYGAPMNEQFGQIPMADLLKWFSKVKDGEGKKISAYFSHATMLDMIFTALGLFNDNPPVTGAFRNPNRNWRSSRSSFSANLVAVLNRCTKEDVTDHSVVFYLNEELLTPMCNQGVCSWEKLEDKLKPFLNTNIDFC